MGSVISLKKPEEPQQPLSFRDKIRLDRYAIKGNRNEIQPGDWVVVLVVEHPKFPVKEIGIVQKVEGKQVTVKLISGGDFGKEFTQYIGKVDKLLEFTSEQIAHRVAEGVASVEKTPKLREYWYEKFYEQIVSGKLVPAGRINAGAGTSEYKKSIGATLEELTLFNCFSGETIVRTKDGLFQIKDLKGKKVTVLSKDGVWREAEFKSYGKQELYEITFQNGEVVRATAGHEWWVKVGSGRLRKVTTVDLEGKRVPVVFGGHPERNEDFYKGLQHGIVFGDGTIQSNDESKSYVLLFGEKQKYAMYFKDYPITPHYDGKYVRVSDMPAYFKSLPDDNESPSYWYGFIVGLLGTDGFCDSRGHVGIHQSDLEVLEKISKNLYKTGFVSTGITVSRELNPYNGSYSPSYKLGFIKQTVQPDDLIKDSHRDKFINSPKSRQGSLKVVSVKPLGIVEEVYCCEEPETHTFVIGSGILTGNCYVIPHALDSRHGLIESLGIQVEIHSRGGGVGQDWSSARPRTAPVLGVRGRSSGAVSWGAGKSFYTGLIEQGGSRRGATMGMMQDWHPDLIEFITCKLSDKPRKLPDGTFRSPLEYIREKFQDKFPGSTIYAHGVEHCNLSVLISDDFMRAVKNDEEWVLEFPDTTHPLYDTHWVQEYQADLRAWKKDGLPTVTYHRYRARDILDLIVECNWMSAEPGVVFLDRYRYMSNSNYYKRGKIIATNPCGEQGLPAWGVCNLSHINLAKFVDTEKNEILLEELAETVRIAVRFLDNVIDHTPYHFKENEEQQKGERRIGLGILGYAEMLIRLGLRYGSKEALEFTNMLGKFITYHGYQASIELAKEKGPFKWFDADGFLSSGHMRENVLPAFPELEKKIRKYGIRNVTIFTVAPTGSTGTMMGTSTGIEPYFSFKYWRNSRLGMTEIVEDVAAEWLEKNGYEVTPENLKYLPDYFVSAMELTPEEHIRTQAVWQKWICSSISKTCNAPNSHTPADIANIVELAYDLGLKGFTYYRDGSRDEQVLATTQDGLFALEKEMKAKPELEVLAQLDSASLKGLIGIAQSFGLLPGEDNSPKPTTEELTLMISGCVGGKCTLD